MIVSISVFPCFRDVDTLRELPCIRRALCHEHTFDVLCLLIASVTASLRVLLVTGFLTVFYVYYY